MAHDPRPHVRRRRHAIARLRSLSAPAAVAGLAGTAGFGAIAALSWSGDPNATPLPASATTNDTTGRAGAAAQPAVPNGGLAQPPTITTPRTGRSGGGHAATGGSH
jgi:hypothetical protein